MSDYKAGDKVSHALFGNGVVAAVSGSGPEARITVDFSASVGRKKLQAAVAKLQKLDGAAVDVPLESSWFEELHVNAKLTVPRRMDPQKIRGEIRDEMARPLFWLAVRDRLRSRGKAPKAIDDPCDNVYVTSVGLLNLTLAVKHDSIADAREGLAARAIFDELAVYVLREFDSFSFTAKSVIQCSLSDADRVTLNESELDELPARDPKMRPKRVQPKGVIRATPKRHDDY